MKIITLDLNFCNINESVASFVIFGSTGPILIETGPASTVGNLKQELIRNNIRIEDIRHVLLTHLHLDHSGASGYLASQGAQIYIHHRAVQHLVNPSRLLKSAARIYGDKMDALWGDTLPIDEKRVHGLHDGDELVIDGVCFRVMDVCGHANHHHVLCVDDFAFVGDIAGIRISRNAFVSLPAPPPEFDAGEWQHSLDKLRALFLKRIYLTHFGHVENVNEHIDILSSEINIVVQYVQKLMMGSYDHNESMLRYVNWYRDRASKAGLSDDEIIKYETANPFYMSIDGIMRYLSQK
tara:strand:- start:27 stop:911 length:885 start_codon:yes stop_codon:yes gene_type:complete